MTRDESPSVLGLQSATTAAANWLRAAILKGQFKPGDRLIELQLARSLGVGQPTIREALKDLELQGFVHKQPKRGTYVTDLQDRDFGEILETRVALEEVAVRRATQTATSADLDYLDNLQKGLLEAAHAFDRPRFHDCDMEFHRTLWRLADNEHLARTLESISFATFAFYVLKLTPDEQHNVIASAELHGPIVEGMRTGDPDKAAKAYRASTLNYWEENHDVGIAAPRHKPAAPEEIG